MPVGATTEVCGQCGFALVKHVSKATRIAQSQQNAVTSLVLGILGLFVVILPFLTTIDVAFYVLLAMIPVAAIVTGTRGARSMPAGSAQLGLAKAGIALGWIAAATIAILLLVGLAQGVD